MHLKKQSLLEALNRLYESQYQLSTTSKRSHDIQLKLEEALSVYHLTSKTESYCFNNYFIFPTHVKVKQKRRKTGSCIDLKERRTFLELADTFSPTGILLVL